MSSVPNSKAHIGRSHFDADTLAAMDEIASLILAYQSLSGMVATFKNAPDLDHAEAQPDAKVVLVAIRQTAAALQEAVLSGKSTRISKITAARKECLEIISHATGSAERLAKMVSETVGGNEINVRVLSTLRSIESAWTLGSH